MTVGLTGSQANSSSAHPTSKNIRLLKPYTNPKSNPNLEIPVEKPTKSLISLIQPVQRDWLAPDLFLGVG